jgi:hydrogenase maturation protein HypF
VIDGPSIRRRIRVTGTVQGVGFRPFVYRHANDLGLFGWVRNDSAGVLIEVEGAETAVVELCRVLVDEPPSLARVTSVTAESIAVLGDDRFVIVESASVGSPTAPVSIDCATCPACLSEVVDPTNRRYRYPFTNCTDCGPRYTIVRSVPYDRPATTMAQFTMCAACQGEYDDPASRRFHAQPNACRDCGPTLEWREHGCDEVLFSDAALDAAIGALRAGRIIAVKGIGGFHLAVDATNGDGVAELRRRKARDDKPFAVMVADVDAARALCVLSTSTAEMLTSPARPIVIVPRLPNAPLASAVAPGSPDVGVMIAYTPLHHLLLAGVGRPLVMTSGNLSDEPIAHDDADARDRLGPLVDGVLGHDRAIYIRCDDSVVRSTSRGRTQALRRSRGMAPEPLPLVIAPSRTILAVGGELKNTISVTVGPTVVASHHIGDLEHLATYRSFRQAIDHLCNLYDVRPEVVAHDLHPEYLSTKFAMDLDLPCVAVQHHHAHVAACLTEHGRSGPVLALAFDGLGYGTDGTLWGGEFMVADLCSFERVGHLASITMPGGTAAIREPWRMGVAWATRAGVEHPFDDPRSAAVVDLARRRHGPTTTSMGRLFDAAATLAGLRPTVTYEAQAAIEFEALARSVPRGEAPIWPVEIAHEEGLLIIDPSPLIAAIITERRRGMSSALLAAGFHESLGRAAANAAATLAREHSLGTVAFTGGVFQNPTFSDVVEQALLNSGYEVLVHHTIPANDGGISVGQAAVAAARSHSI